MPVWFVIAIILEFAWLFYETKFLTVTLYMGGIPKRKKS